MVKFIDPPFMKFGLSILMRKGDETEKIKSMRDLGNQDKVKYGLVGGGSTESFFRDPDRKDVYFRMWGKMKQPNSGSLLDSVEHGVKRVRESTDSHPFAFIGEEYTMEYHASREPCDLVAVAGDVEIYDGEYHLALFKDLDTDTTDKLKKGLENLNKTGRLDDLYKKWWKERAQCSRAPSSTAVTSGTAVLVPIVLAILFRVNGE